MPCSYASGLRWTRTPTGGFGAQPRCSELHPDWKLEIHKAVVCPPNGKLVCHNEEGDSATRCNMGELQGHYAE